MEKEPLRETTLEYWEKRCAELEAVVEAAAHALSLLPVQQIAKGYDWTPSEVAVQQFKAAKNLIEAYAEEHWI